MGMGLYPGVKTARLPNGDVSFVIFIHHVAVINSGQAHIMTEDARHLLLGRSK